MSIRERIVVDGAPIDPGSFVVVDAVQVAQDVRVIQGTGGSVAEVGGPGVGDGGASEVRQHSGLIHAGLALAWALYQVRWVVQATFTQCGKEATRMPDSSKWATSASCGSAMMRSWKGSSAVAARSSAVCTKPFGEVRAVQVGRAERGPQGGNVLVDELIDSQRVHCGPVPGRCFHPVRTVGTCDVPAVAADLQHPVLGDDQPWIGQVEDL